MLHQPARPAEGPLLTDEASASIAITVAAIIVTILLVTVAAGAW